MILDIFTANISRIRIIFQNPIYWYSGTGSVGGSCACTGGTGAHPHTVPATVYSATLHRIAL